MTISCSLEIANEDRGFGLGMHVHLVITVIFLFQKIIQHQLYYLHPSYRPCSSAIAPKKQRKKNLSIRVRDNALIQVENGGRFDVINMLEVIQYPANYPEIDDESVNGCSITQGQHDSPFLFSEEEEIPMETNYRYKRYDRIQIQPINFDSSSSDNEKVLNFEVPTNLGIPATTILIQRIKDKRQKIKKVRESKKKDNKMKKPSKKVDFMDEEKEWDSPKNWQLPEQCLTINRQQKQENYNKLHDSILACIEGKSQTKAIFLYGGKDTGKKTILFDVVNNIKYKIRKQQEINQHYLCFEEQFHSNVNKKIEILYGFLKKTINPHDKHINQFKNQVEKDMNQQGRKGEGLQTILIIDDYKSFLSIVRQSLVFKKMKKLLTYNKSILFLFIDSNITKRQMQMLNLKSYIEISVTNNTKTYFTMSLLTAVNNYPYKGARWEMMRPLANYFSTKMDQNNKLRLSIIRKLIMFLEKIEKQSQSLEQKRRVNGEVIENFMRKFVDRTVKIDLKKLPIHEKAILTACYVSMKQNLSLFLPIKSLYKQYSWVCQSMGLRAKPFKDFSQELIFQLTIYKLIRLQNQRNSQVQANIILMIDIDAIEQALKEESVLSKFYK